MTAFSVARVWFEQLRVHQWSKNLLIFVPLLAAHAWNDGEALVAAGRGFAAFCLAASAVYISNDLNDLEHDKSHPRKRSRPLPSGRVSRFSAILAAGLCLAIGAVFSISVNFKFALCLCGYVLGSFAYSFWLKRLVVIDAIVLACFYSLRIIAGSVAVQVTLSEWLIAFSTFLFLSLAFAKRYVELVHFMDPSAENLAGRGYRREDHLPVLMFGIAAGFSSILVLSLYISSEAVTVLYAAPELLWLSTLVFVYWISWIWLSAHRGEMHDDPVIFSISDRRSQLSGVAMLIVAVLSTVGY